MELADWLDGHRHTLAMWVDGRNTASTLRAGLGDLCSHPPGEHASWLVVLHAGAEGVLVTLPGREYGERFSPVLDTGSSDGQPVRGKVRRPGRRMLVPARTVLVFQAHR